MSLAGVLFRLHHQPTGISGVVKSAQERCESDAAVAWFEQQRKTRPATSPQPALGLHIAMGPDFPAMAANLERNLREKRIGLTQAVVERP